MIKTNTHRLAAARLSDPAASFPLSRVRGRGRRDNRYHAKPSTKCGKPERKGALPCSLLASPVRACRFFLASQFMANQICIAKISGIIRKISHHRKNMNSKQAQNILITDYLASEGIQPAHTTHSRRFYWYHSPIREGDSKPSLKVDTLNNTWYDYGSGLFDHEKFRRLPDLVIAHKNVTFSEVLRILEYKNLGNPSLFAKPSPSVPQNKSNYVAAVAKQKNKKESGAFELVKAADLQNPHLIAYLESRGINADIAKSISKSITTRRGKKYKTNEDVSSSKTKNKYI